MLTEHFKKTSNEVNTLTKLIQFEVLLARENEI